MFQLLQTTALVEVVAGFLLLVAPSMSVQLLFCAPLEARAPQSIARIGGAGLLTLGIAAWFISFDAKSRAAMGFVRAMIVYNSAAAIILAVTGSQTGSQSITLWSGVALHTALTAWCGVMSLKRPQSQAPDSVGASKII